MKEGTSEPWDHAKAMRSELESEGPAMFRSSAWVMLGAISDWEKKGHDYVETAAKKIYAFGDCILRTNRSELVEPSHRSPISLWAQGLAALSNAIIRDPRVFHIKENKWMQLLNDQGAPIILHTPCFAYNYISA